jgi:hypothetical protein
MNVVTKNGILAKYCGQVDGLTDKVALVRIDGRAPEKCMAKFEDQTGLAICYQGWAPYHTMHFNIRPSQQAEYWELQPRGSV